MSDTSFSILVYLGNIDLPPIIQLETEGILNEKECIVILYASWSGPALFVIRSAAQQLSQQNYPHPVYLIDHDSLTIEKQFSLLGELGQGWGEIFIFRQGIIIQKFTGKNAWSDFQNFMA